MAWVLAVDFGTSNTVAAVAEAAGVRVLNVNGRPVMASAVFLHDEGWYVGDTAVRMARHRLDRFEACPKRAIPDGSLFLGGEDVPVADAITALFRPILAEALEQHGGVPPHLFVVTHPATWTASRIELLLSAAAAAAPGPWPRPQPLAEPVAAAQRVLYIENVPPAARLVVLDLGGGTTDVTVVDRHADRLTVVGNPLGRDGLGGVDFDLRLARWMVAEVNAEGLYDRLAGADDPELRERAVDIREHARDVKEQLSRQSVVPAHLPKSPPELPDHTPVQVSRQMLESLIRGSDEEPGLEQAVALVHDALRAAPPGPGMVGVFLVGGSSRIPLLGMLVTQRVSRVPIRHGDPTTAVAEGAARYGWGVLHGEHDQVRPGSAASGFSGPATPAPGFATPAPGFATPAPGFATPAPGFAGPASGFAGSAPGFAGSAPNTGSATPPSGYAGPGNSGLGYAGPGTPAPGFAGPSALASGPGFPGPGYPGPSAGMPPHVPPPVNRTRRKVVLLLVLLLLLAAGGIFTYIQVSDTDDPPAESVYGTAVIDIPVYDSPSLQAPVVGDLLAGDTVKIVCTTFGQAVPDGAGGSNDLWDGLDGGGYVPAVVLDTGSSLPPSEPC
jgi:hypothetical protein